MKFIVKLTGTWTLKDDATVDFNDRRQFDADSIAELKQKFEEYLTNEAYEKGYKSIMGNIESVEQMQWNTVLTDGNYSGTFVNTENVDIDLS